MKDRSETAAGGVVYRRVDDNVLIALGEQRDRLSGERTVRLPKGKPDRNESLEQTALREVREETGLVAQIIAPLGAVQYEYREDEARVSKEVHFFLMKLVPGEELPRDGELERIYWCAIDEAADHLSYEPERRAVVRARERIGELR
jgi:8-oxo-dGTP pyrophosphatase MutT (NUDIX family)